MSGMEQNLEVKWQYKSTGIPDNLFLEVESRLDTRRNPLDYRIKSEDKRKRENFRRGYGFRERVHRIRAVGL